jgi:hypothetical protein
MIMHLVFVSQQHQLLMPVLESFKHCVFLAQCFFSWRFRQIWRFLCNSVGDKGKIAWQFSPNSVAK